MINDFELIGNNTVKCKTCGKEMPTGIIGISGHWVQCTGKEFHTALMKKAEKKKITTEDVEGLQNDYLR